MNYLDRTFLLLQVLMLHSTQVFKCSKEFSVRQIYKVEVCQLMSLCATMPSVDNVRTYRIPNRRISFRVSLFTLTVRHVCFFVRGSRSPKVDCVARELRVTQNIVPMGKLSSGLSCSAFGRLFVGPTVTSFGFLYDKLVILIHIHFARGIRMGDPKEELLFKSSYPH